MCNNVLMTLEADFIAPDPEISKIETAKRKELITWFADVVDKAVVGFIVSGSMGYGADYSVKESSDIDMQLLVTPTSAPILLDSGVFDEAELKKALHGYLARTYGQFSLVFQKDGVNMECHFWDADAFTDAITFRAGETKRLRSNIDTPSTDHGFSFKRDESIKDYYGELVDGHPVGAFPSYRIENNTLYLCRPITNILGLPQVIKTNEALDAAIETSWSEAVNRLAEHTVDGRLDLDKFNIENTLPGKNKMSQDVLDAVRQKTRNQLNSVNINFSG